MHNLEEILTKWLQQNNPEETLEGTTITQISHIEESYTYQIVYDNGIMDVVSVNSKEEVTHLNPYFPNGDEYRDGWYFFPCINFPIRVTKDRIPMQPYIHFASYDECLKWVREYHAPRVDTVTKLSDTPSGHYGC
jgi:hypothetical protein